MSDASGNDLKSCVDDLKMKGNMAFIRHDFDEAENLYTEALALDPENHILYGNRSAARLGLEDYKQALEDADKAIQLAPRWSKGHYRRGLCLEKLEKFRDAQRSFENVAKLDPRARTVMGSVNRNRRLANELEKKRPIASMDAWINLYRELDDIRDRLGSFVYFWNNSSPSERRKVFLRFRGLLGNNVEGDGYPEEMMKALPLHNYEGFEMPKPWLEFYNRLPLESKLSVLERMYGLTTDQEKTLILADVRYFIENQNEGLPANNQQNEDSPQADINAPVSGKVESPDAPEQAEEPVA